MLLRQSANSSTRNPTRWGKRLSQASLHTCRRSLIGERLAAIEDPRPGVGLRPDGLPDIDWCKVELEGRLSVEVEVEKDRSGKVKVDLPFYIARYAVTYIQFQSFIEALDGYHNRERNWFEGLGADDSDKQLAEQRFKFPNHANGELVSGDGFLPVALLAVREWSPPRRGGVAGG